MPFHEPFRGLPQKFHKMGRALRHRNYRLFYSGQIISLMGTWLSTVATSWLVYKICARTDPSQAAVVLGMVGFIGQLPVFLVTPFAGVWIDRANRHRILKITQAVSMLQSFALAYLALRGTITIPQIFVLSAIQGLVNAFDMPARQAFVVEMVDDRKDLSNAIALNSSMVHTARLVGPSVAGFLIYSVGEGFCFLIDGFSYFAVLIALFFIRVQPRQVAIHESAFGELRDGFLYAHRSPAIRSMLVLVATASLMFVSQSVLMPIMADRILGGGERTLGFLLGASGFGALMGSLYLASRESVRGLGKVIQYAIISLGGGLIAFSLCRWLPLAFPILIVTGGSTVLLMASCNTVLQTIVEDHMRGRVMSLFAMAFMGMAPFGSLLAGTLAGHIGASATFGVCGVVCLVSAYSFSKKLPELRGHLRALYESKGILPSVVNQ